MEAPAVRARSLLVAAVLVAALAAIGIASALAARVGGRARAPDTGSTLSSTWVDPRGNGILERGPGEPLHERTELAPARRPVRTLATFAQITDAHVQDEESPARVQVLDRLGPPFDSSFRPQEALSPQVLAGAVAAVNRLRPQAVAVTGDLIDNAQENELDQALAVLRGGRVDPDSGRPGYDGVQAADDPDPFFYRPDVDAPRHPGLLAQAERPFHSPGLRAPWYAAVGNHDVLTQGVVAPGPQIARAAVGSRRLVELSPDLSLPRSSRAISPELVEQLLSQGIGRTVWTPPDPRRRPLAASETVNRLARASHAHSQASPARLDYTFDIGDRVRGIVLDTARRDAGSGGLLDPLQLGWLRGALGRAGSRYVVVFSHHPLDHTDGGGEALRLLAADTHVIAAVSGHLHHNAIRPLRGRAGGLWLIQTASLADFPQQARAFRVVETAGGGVALETWMLDTAGGRLASISRELSYIDAQGGRPSGDRGRRVDRNVRLELGRRG